MICYLNGSPDLPLTLKADATNIFKWWVDGSYAVHPNFRSQTGGTGYLGKGSIISTSTKQKLNTRSSTETELVDADDLVPHACWTNYFLDCQGYRKETAVAMSGRALLVEKSDLATNVWKV